MASTPAAKSDLNRKWWLWPLLPFALLGGIIGFAAIFAMITVSWPFMAYKARRERALAKRVLTANCRLINWLDAIAAVCESNNGIVLELGAKGPTSMWLVELPAELRNDFLTYPTYADWEADPRSALENCMKIDKSSPQLITCMRLAKRIDDRPSDLSELDSLTKESIRILTVYNEASPSAFLHRSLRSNNNA